MNVSSWAWVTGLLDEPPRFRDPDQWHWPRAVTPPGLLNAVGQGGRYELLGLLREGGQAALWAARDRGDGGALVVVKLVPSTSRETTTGPRLFREARLLQRLGNERTVMSVRDYGPGRLLDSSHGEHETLDPWLVLPYVDHVLLSRALRLRPTPGQPGLGPDIGWAIGRDLALALQHLSRNGVVHRDLSPGNLLLTPNGAVLSDLGLAWMESVPEVSVEERFTTGLSVAGLGGTPGWFPPEGVSRPEDGRRPDRDPAYDVFPWGLLVFASLAGRHPWAREGLQLDASAANRMYVAGAGPDLHLPKSAENGTLLDLIRHALAPVPGDRPTADELVARLGPLSPSQTQQAAEEANRKRDQDAAAAELMQVRKQLQLIELTRTREAEAARKLRTVRAVATARARSVLGGRSFWLRLALVPTPLAVFAVAAAAVVGIGVIDASSAADRAETVASALTLASRADLALAQEVNRAVAVASLSQTEKAVDRNSVARLSVLAERTDANRDALVRRLSQAPAAQWSTDARQALEKMQESESQLIAARKASASARNGEFADQAYAKVLAPQRALIGALVRDLTVATDDPSVAKNARAVSAIVGLVDAASSERSLGTGLLGTGPVVPGDRASILKISGYITSIATQGVQTGIALDSASPKSAGALRAALDQDSAALDDLRRDILATGELYATDVDIRTGKAQTFSEVTGQRLTRIAQIISVVADEASASAASRRAELRTQALQLTAAVLGALLLTFAGAVALFNGDRRGSRAEPVGTVSDVPNTLSLQDGELGSKHGPPVTQVDGRRGAQSSGRRRGRVPG